MTTIEQLKNIKEQNNLEKVITKIEKFRQPARYKLIEGGRGSAKSWSAGSLILQKSNYERKKILCCREIQKSIDQSVHALLCNTIKRLRYNDWIIRDNWIEHKKVGSLFIFQGLRDIRAATSTKSIEDVDICWVEEAHSVVKESWDILIPSIRNIGSEIWATWNATSLYDPVNDLKNREDVIHEFVTYRDNPFFNDVLEKERLYDLEHRPADYQHIWEGLPRNIGDNTVFSIEQISEAVKREASDEGAEECGVDVARYGNDETVMRRRKGMKHVAVKRMRKAETVEVANAIWDFIDHRRNIPIKIDSGYNPGVIDVLRSFGALVIPIGFGESANDQDLYVNTISEMWFTFPIDEAEVPDEQELKLQLSSRKYKYDNKGRKCIESKDEYKNRTKKNSPDDADSLLLCYYSAKNATFDDDIRDAMRARRAMR
jgi:phage terminase large subunit